VFATDHDRRFVVERAARAFAETGATCLGWSILNNHYHVLVRCGGPPGATFARLNTAIACRALRRRGEHGSVFQNRFYSDTCDDEDSLLERLAYVVGNPVHHRVVPCVEALRRYEWSALGEILGERETRWTDVGAALALLHPDPGLARDGLLRLLAGKAESWAQEAGDPDADRAMPKRATGPLRPASPDSVVERSFDDTDALRAALAREGWTPALLVPAACRLAGADATAVRIGGQARPEYTARSVVAFVACDVAGRPMSEVAALLGVRPTALPNARRRGRARLAALGLSAGEVLALSRAVVPAEHRRDWGPSP
jgi:hypothetical protein